MLVLLLEWNLSSRLLGLTHDLNLDSLCSDVVEDKLGTSGAFGVYSSSHTNLDIFEMLARLD